MALSAPPEKIRVTLDGTELSLERTGRGPPILLVHGLGGPAMWERVVPLLGDRCETIVPHLPGFGESPPPGRPFRAEDHAQLLARLLDEVDLRGVTVAGTSYGGEIAALLAVSRPDRIEALVLICPTGTRRHAVLLRAPMLRKALRRLLRNMLPNRRIAEALSRSSFHDVSSRPPGLVDRYLEHLGRPGNLECLVWAVTDIWSRGDRLPGIIRGLAFPVRVVWGGNDRTIPPNRAASLERAGDHVRTIILEGCAHSVALEKPDELSRIILPKV